MCDLWALSLTLRLSQNTFKSLDAHVAIAANIYHNQFKNTVVNEASIAWENENQAKYNTIFLTFDL